MAADRYSDSRSTYSGGIKYVPNYGNRTSSVNPNSSNAYRAASIYNLPYRDSVATYYDVSNAAANNAKLIAEALERARRAREEAIRRAEEEARKRAADIEEARAKRAAEYAAEQGVGTVPATQMDIFDKTNPGGGVRVTDPSVAAGVSDTGVRTATNFRTTSRQLAEQMAKQQGLYVLPMITLTNGNTVYALTDTPPDEMGMGPGRSYLSGDRGVAAAATSADAMEEIMRQRREGLAREREGDLTEDILINAWRDADPDSIMRMMDQMYYNRAVKVWGEPYEIKEPVVIGFEDNGDPILRTDDNTGETIYQTVGLDWTYKVDEETGARLGGRPVSYLGMSPDAGEEFLLSVNTRRIPSPDADISEWRKFIQGIPTFFTAPKYMPESVYSTLQWMPVEDRVKMQKQFVAAGLYETNDPIKFGRISPEDNAIMTGLMSEANQQGITWEQALTEKIMLADKAKAQAASYSSGGGGGGGGATTVYKQIQYNQTSVAQARSLLIGVLTEALGRYPTDKEVQEFLDIVNKREKKSPTKTVTKTTNTGDTTRAVSRTTPSDVDVQALAEEFAGGLEGYDENAADRYLNALLNSMGAASA
jgi:hypothetical protein